jgi:hypothetical protein
MTESARPMGKLTPHMLTQACVIAKGKRIRDVRRLVTTYGGKRAMWVKKSSSCFELGRHYYEYHWYEHPGIGRVELKRKGCINFDRQVTAEKRTLSRSHARAKVCCDWRGSR